jgi:mannose-6-phosphate isomerase-like protein (cupin superfamily)
MKDSREFNVFQVEKPWGNFRQFTHNENSTVKTITVNPNEELSLQSHEKRSEFWKVLQGGGVFEIGDTKYDVKEGDENFIPVGVKHRLIGGENGIMILEIATGDFDEEDIIRYEDKYGRAK